MRQHVHADVLKMAGTREMKELIKWLHARKVFFAAKKKDEQESETVTLALGLELARDSGHEDALFLLSIFPNDPPRTVEVCET